MGTVTIAAKISPEGTVIEAEVQRGHPILREAAKANVLTWRFEPSVETKSIEANVQFVLPDTVPAEGYSCGFTFTIPNHLRVVTTPVLVETMETDTLPARN